MPIGAYEPVPIYVYISVRDSGPGLHPKDLELLVSGRSSKEARLTRPLLVPKIPARIGKYGSAVWVSLFDHSAFRILMRCLEALD